MTEQCEKIKTKPTALAQLVAIHMANGITSTKALSDETGYSERAIRKAKAELECRNYSAARNQSAAQPGTIVPEAEPECRNQSAVSRARAYKESSSKILFPEEFKKRTPLPPKGGPSPSDCLSAFEAYNATALECGLQQASKLTKDRDRKIKARLKEHGIDGWSVMLANVAKSSFLTGSNERGWRVTLDWLVNPTNFVKVHDGSYGNGRDSAQPVSQEKAEAMENWRRKAEEAQREMIAMGYTP